MNSLNCWSRTTRALHSRWPFLCCLHRPFYAHRHLNQVAALVLVDPSTEYQFTRYASVHREAAKKDAAALIHARDCLKSAQTGTLSNQCQIQPPRDLPASRADWWRQQAPALAEAILLEYLDMNSISSDQLSAERSLGSLPLLLLGRDLSDEIWRKMHEETLSISSNSKLEIIAGAGHQIQEDQPMAFVEAVNGVVAQVRARNKQGGGPVVKKKRRPYVAF